MNSLIISLLLLLAPRTTPATTHLRIVDQNGALLRDSTLRILRFDDFTTSTRAVSSGETDLTLDTGSSVVAFAPGHVPARVYWSPNDGSPLVRQPAAIEFRLSEGVKVGGKILNDEGKPVARAEVYLSFTTPEVWEVASPTKPANWFWDIPIMTDADGQWTCDMAPPTWKNGFVRPIHPDYAESQSLQPQQTSELRNATSVGTLAVGRAVSGIVRGPDGAGVAGAIVQAGQSLGDRTPRLITNADGTFAFQHAEDGSARLLVRAAGLAPQIVVLSSGAVAGLDIRLVEPRNLHGTVVDQAGQPVAHAAVAFAGWGDRQVLLRDWMYYTDDAGRFAFDVPPAESINLCRVTGPKGATPQMTVAADQNDIRVVLEQSITVRGKVVDAVTNQPIASFKVFQATDDEGLANDWNDPQPFEGGEFQRNLFSSVSTHRLRIEADGHLPVMSDLLVPRDGQCTFDVAMKPAKNLTGIVLGVDGKPLAHARVVPVFARNSMFQPSDLLAECAEAEGVNTDDRGAFSLPPLEEPFTVVVAHEAGFACLSDKAFAKSPSITLTPWARIEGKTSEPSVGLWGGRQLLSPETNEVTNSPSVQANAAGHYSFAYIVPGKVSVTRSVGHGVGSQTRTINTAAGQTTLLDFDVGNHTLRGTIELPMEVPTDATHSLGETARKDPGLRVHRLTHLDKNDAAELREAPAPGTMLSAGASLNFDFVIQHDGSFVIPNVEPGKYELVVEKAVGSPGGYCGEGELVARHRSIVTITDQSSESIDLGKVRLDLAPRIAVGQEAPDFTVPTLDGKEIHLSDLRGKYVLLDFWATWCGPCKAEEPFLRATFEKYKADDRFVMISLSADEKREVLQQYVAKHDLPWKQAWLGKFDDSPVLKSYYIRGVPSIWLIGPDGKVLAKNLRETGISRMTTQALADGK